MFSWWSKNTCITEMGWNWLWKEWIGVQKIQLYRLAKRRRLPGWKSKGKSKYTHLKANMHYSIPSVKIECYWIKNRVNKWEEEDGGGMKTPRKMIYAFNIHISIWNQFPMLSFSCTCDVLNVCVFELGALYAGNTEKKCIYFLDIVFYKRKVIAHLWWWIFYGYIL